MTTSDTEPTRAEQADEPDVTDAPADGAGDQGAPDTDPGDAPAAAGGRRSPLLIAAVALLVLCAGAAVWFGVAWVRAYGDADLKVGAARDDAVRAGEQAVITFHTMDYRAVDENLDRWVAASTGDMLGQLERGRASGKSVIEQSKRISTATVYSTALIDLNDTTGTATIISAVHQKITEAGAQQPVDKYLRVQAALQRGEDGGWKLSGLTYIAPTPAA